MRIFVQNTQDLKYVDVIVPLPLEGTFTYLVPDSLAESARVGMRVVVPFGKNKLYTGIICLVHSLKPEKYDTKEIICFLDDSPVIRRPQYKFWEWISGYYMAQPGEVYKAAVPAGLKLESETLIRLNEDYQAEGILPGREQQLLDLLSDLKDHSLLELTRQMDLKDLMPVVKRLLEKQAVEVMETLTEKFKPRKQQYLRIHPGLKEEAAMHTAFAQLQRAAKQLKALMQLIDLSLWFRNAIPLEISRKDFIEKTGTSPSILLAMAERGVIELYDKEIGRLEGGELDTRPVHPLSPDQDAALKSIRKSFIEFQTVLLHGVTSSGKTEIYSHLIEEVLESGRQVLYLVPEIALTTQLTDRLRAIFGNRLGVYHSKFSDAERVEIWNDVLHDGQYDLILGVRSSIFLPFRHLGLVIVDEEHEPSYKQYDPAPRYHARNAAIVLAGMHGAKVLLGTATPSIESYYNAAQNKYGLVELKTRHEDIELPEIRVVDTKDAYRRKQMSGHFSDTLLEETGKALQKGEQIILFQNRRGYAPWLECKACAYVPKCQHCDVSLTYHQVLQSLSCHYCGYTESLPSACPHCNENALQTRGFGTEKIEDEMKEIFPEARIGRMDLDTTRNRKSYQQIIGDFESHKLDILVGTQMVTKGLDFANVSLVGILHADSMLNYPDFRAFERAFQLMAQVSGRAGRKKKRGLVVLQTASPEHPVVGQVIRNDFAAMYNGQCQERSMFRYPPFCRMVQISLRHKELPVLLSATQYFSRNLLQVFGARIQGPVVPAISRVQNQYIRQFILKLELEASPSKAKELLNELMKQLLLHRDFRSVRITVDVDPN